MINDNGKTPHFTTVIPVRIDDINYGGHLDHARVITYTHQTRAQFLKHYQQSEIDCFGQALVMLELHVKYKAEGFFGDEISCHLYVHEIGKVTITFLFRLYNKQSNKILAEATTIMGCFDAKKGKLRKPVQGFYDFFQGFLKSTV
jgi:acyl-CoA thioester hydrolase